MKKFRNVIDLKDVSSRKEIETLKHIHDLDVNTTIKQNDDFTEKVYGTGERFFEL